MALYPDVDSPFQDERDIVNRLLPYHVFQLPRQDPLLNKGKGKAADYDSLIAALEGKEHVIQILYFADSPNRSFRFKVFLRLRQTLSKTRETFPIR